MINLTTKEIKGYSNSEIAKSEKNDCFVRALAAGFEISYNDAHALAKERLENGPYWHPAVQVDSSSNIGNIPL